MPVIDHDVHPSTMKGPDFRYGCWNRKPFKKGYFAPHRFMPVKDAKASFHNQAFVIKAKWIDHNMSSACRYDMSISDPNCTDCKHRGSGEAYAQSVREQGA